MNEKHTVQEVFDQHLSSLRFQPESRRVVMERALGKEEKVMKKKLSAALVFALALALMAAVALAAAVVMRSERTVNINLAREALYEKYGLTLKTLGLFVFEGREEKDGFTLTWTCNTFHPSLTGVYTTVEKDGKAEAAWSYDDVDKAVYDSGDLSASVWGCKQLEASFANKEKAAEYSLALYRQDRENGKSTSPYTAQVPLGQGERYWQDEIIRAAEPGANDLTRDQAYAIAVQVLSEDFGMDKNSLAAGVITDGSFHARANGKTLWDISIYVTIDGVEYDCVVRLDGATGEVLSVDVLTGGNG